MFDGHYFQRYESLLRGLISSYPGNFWFQKNVLDLGCGDGSVGICFYRLGSSVVACDARQSHLDILNKKSSKGIKTVLANLDVNFPFHNQKFDVVLDLGLICHLSPNTFEKHLRDVCSITTHLILETTVIDSLDPNKIIEIKESKASYDLSFNSLGCRPSPANIERVLTSCGMDFKRITSSKYNTTEHSYDWISKDDHSTNLGKRVLYFAIKSQAQIETENQLPTAITPQLNILPSSFNNLPSVFNQATNVLHNSGRPILTATPRIPAATRIAEIKAYQAAISVNSKCLKQKKFVIVIPSYKNSAYCLKNIISALNQNYNRYRIIFTDDCSTDDTFNKVANFIKTSDKLDKITLIKNSKRIGALHNLYNMIHSCSDDEIIITLDGDDWLANDNVLNKLNEYYNNYDIWMSYGQYINSDGGGGISHPYPINVVASNSFRQHPWAASHLRSFYAWLFKKIRKEDLMHKGQFFVMTWDMAMMFPMLELSHNHSKFITDVLYIYNVENPINDHKVDLRMQQNFDRQIRGMHKYTECEAPKLPEEKEKMTKVGLLLIATHKYKQFLQPIITSADKYFLNDCDVSYYVFSDHEQPLQSNRKINNIHIEHKPFPYASADRWKHFVNNEEKLLNEEYLFYVDVDCLFVDEIKSEDVLSNLVGVRHCGYINGGGTFELNMKSMAYIEPAKRKIYYGGGYSGGIKTQYMELAKWCYNAFEEDQIKGIMPIYADESILNKYFSEHEPTKILNCDYHYPQSNLEHYKKIWGKETFKAKILLLDKNHEEMRK